MPIVASPGPRQIEQCGVLPWSLVLDWADEPVPVHNHPLQRARADDRVWGIW
jgi:hypothetical protein